MAITLDSLTLPDQLVWQDRFSWAPVAGSQARTLQGRMAYQAAATAGESGRPITMGSDDAWIEYSDLLTLQEWAQDASKTMTLTMHDSTTYAVVFRHWEPPVFEVEQVGGPTATNAATDYFRLRNLRLAVL